MTVHPTLLYSSIYVCVYTYICFPGSSVVKNPPANARDVGSIPVSGKSPREGNGNPLQDSHLENSIDRGAWRATVHGVTKSQTPLSKQVNPYNIYIYILEKNLNKSGYMYMYN